MEAGFPRPRKHIKKIKILGQGHWKNHDWSEWDNKTYPIPYTAHMDSVGVTNAARVSECRYLRNCIVCGIKVEDETPWAYIWSNTFPEDAGPFHEKCVRLTQKMCPVVATSTGEFRFVQTTWKALELRIVPDSQKEIEE